MKRTVLNYIKFMAVLLFTAMLASCGKPKDLNFGMIHNLAIKNMNNGDIIIEAVLPIENPNSYRITANNANVSVLSGTSEVARIKQNLPVVVPGNSKGEYTINATISLGNSNILSLMNVVSSNTDLNLNGTATISSFIFKRDVPIHKTGVQNYLRSALNGVKLF
jgi:hypothetical protein